MHPPVNKGVSVRFRLKAFELRPAMRPARKRAKGRKGSKSAKDIDECGSLSDTENYVRDEMGVVRITPAVERVVCHPSVLAAEDTWRRTTPMLEQLAYG